MFYWFTPPRLSCWYFALKMIGRMGGTPLALAIVLWVMLTYVLPFVVTK